MLILDEDMELLSYSTQRFYLPSVGAVVSVVRLLRKKERTLPLTTTTRQVLLGAFCVLTAITVFSAAIAILIS